MKKIISLIMAFILSLFSVPFFQFACKAADVTDILGDVNSDGRINATDALIIMQYTTELPQGEIVNVNNGDLNHDGAVNSSDALLILTLSAKGYYCDGKVSIDLSKYTQLDEIWMLNVIKNYEEFTEEISGDKNKIPVIVSTDQHGLAGADCQVFDFINELTDWSKISKIINLGDTVKLMYSKKQLNGYRKAMSGIPVEKRLETEGNHDSHISLIHRDMSEYFPAYGAEYSEDGKAFCVKDDEFNVRYLTVNPMGYPWTYESGKIGTQQADFIVKELEKKDESNIVLLSHTYLFRDNIVKRDGSVFTGSDYFIGSSKKGADVKQSFVDMLNARNKGLKGVFTDSRGVEHPYDFSGCNGRLLMTLHGHHHTEGYEKSNGITEFLFQSFRHNGSEENEPYCFYFAYIDPASSKFKCIKNIPGYSSWEIDIA